MPSSSLRRSVSRAVSSSCGAKATTNVHIYHTACALRERFLQDGQRSY